MRRSHFQRDFYDLHGEEVPEFDETERVRFRTTQGWIEVTPRYRQMIATRRTHWLAGLWLGAMGLFWTIVLGLAALSVGVVTLIFLWAALTTPAGISP